MKKGFIRVPILIALIVGATIFGVGGYYISQKTNALEQTPLDIQIVAPTTKKVDPFAEEVKSLREEVEKLKNQKPQVVIKEVKKPATKPNFTSIVNQWRPRIAYIECEWRGPSGLISSASGSGVLGPKTSIGTYYIMTNKHVVGDKDNNYNPATRCDIWLPDVGNVYTVTADLDRMTMDEISFDPIYDYGNILIDKATPKIISTANNNKYSACETRADIGEEVLILGYPGIGSFNDITVTEGVISGYEDGYYITSAKVEQGNSGGAAILVKDSCYLGIPSFAYTGKIESLARILDLSSSAPIWSQ